MEKPLVFTNNDSGYETAIEFKKNGVDPIILDTRKEPQSEIIEEAKNMNINIKNSYVVVAAQGYKKVKSADIAKISDDKEELGSVENINVIAFVFLVLDLLQFIWHHNQEIKQNLTRKLMHLFPVYLNKMKKL